MYTKNDAIKDILKHQTRVSIKMSSIGNDIAIRGRRHDISYSEEVELEVYQKAHDENNPNQKHYKGLLRDIHARHNDYMLGFHQGDISKMNLIQLLELISDLVVVMDENVVERGYSASVEEYQEFVLSSFPELPEELLGIIGETVEYIVDRNRSILKNLPKEFDTSNVTLGDDING